MADAAVHMHGRAPGPSFSAAGALMDSASAPPAAAVASPSTGAATDAPLPVQPPPLPTTSPSEASRPTAPDQPFESPQSAASPPFEDPTPPVVPAQSGSSAIQVELFPADITAVHTAQELVDAMANSARDIEIRAHLDLRTIPLQANPGFPFRDADYEVVATDLAFIRWPTRSVRGNCSMEQSGDAGLQQLLVDLVGELLPLKPFQCLLVTDASTFYIRNANGLWFDNIYVGFTEPRRRREFGAFLSAGDRAFLNVNGYSKPINIFMTNMTVHGHGNIKHISQVLSMTPNEQQVSLLIQDSVFTGLVGPAPPFLFAFGTHATFKDCVFKDVVLPRSELFDVSHYGSVCLANCHFTNISTGPRAGLADTTYNDFHPLRPYAVYIVRGPNGFFNDYIEEEYAGYYGDLDHINYDFVLAPAPDSAAELYGSDYIIHNQSMSDCVAVALGGTEIVLPGCPKGSVNVRRQHASELKAQVAADDDATQQDPGSPQQAPWPSSSYADPYDYDWIDDYQNSRRAKASNPFYAQYYQEYSDYMYPENLYPVGSEFGYPAPAPYDYQYVYDANSPWNQPGYEATKYIIPYLGNQLSDDHPWLDAVQQVLPQHPPPPPGAAVQFRNGLPLCTNCTNSAPPHTPEDLHSHTRRPAAGNRALIRTRTSVVVAVMLVAAVTAAAIILWCCHRRRRFTGKNIPESVTPPEGGVAGKDGTGGDREAGALSATAALHAQSMHLSITRDLKQHQGPSEVLSWSYQADAGLKHPPCPLTTEAGTGSCVLESTPSSAMNERYEYRLPPGLGMAVFGTGNGGGEAGDTSGRYTGCHASQKDSFVAPGVMPSGTGWSGLDLCPTTGTSLVIREGTGSMQRSEVTPSATHQATSSSQARGLDISAAGTDAASVNQLALRRLTRQLNSLRRQDLLLGRFESMGPRQRRHGGQAVVQFVIDPRDGGEFAVKFFLQEEAFRAEAALYSACFPSLRSHLSATELCQSLVDKGDEAADLGNAPSCTGNAATSHHDAVVTQSPSESLHPDRSPSSDHKLYRSKLSASGADHPGGHALNGGSGKVEMPSESANPSTSEVGRRLTDDEGPTGLPGGDLQLEVVSANGGCVAGAFDTDVQFRHRRAGSSPGDQEEPQVHAGQLSQQSQACALSAIPSRAPASPSVHGGAAEACARFLPQVETMCDHAVDPRGRPWPPCIVMEKGESLQDWSNRAEPDLFTSLAVLSNVALRLAVMHEAGFVHRDLKPANVMWLPRENRWTVIDFGCAARVGAVAPLSITLAYAAPEVVEAHEEGQIAVRATEALDAWSLGVMAFELLTGAPAFKFLTEGRAKVVSRLKGDLPLPWEEDSPTRSKLGLLKDPVLQLLRRRAGDRIGMRRFHGLAARTFSGPTTNSTE